MRLARAWRNEAINLSARSTQTYELTKNTNADDATIYSVYEDDAAAASLDNCANDLYKLLGKLYDQKNSGKTKTKTTEKIEDAKLPPARS